MSRLAISNVRPVPGVSAEIIATTHFLFLLLLQFENLVISVEKPVAADILWLFAGQWQNLVSSVLVGLVYLVARRSQNTRILFNAGFAFLLLFYALDQTYFHIFHLHFSFSQTDEFTLGNLSDYWGSFTAELGMVQIFNFFLVAIVLILLVVLPSGKGPRRQTTRRLPWAATPFIVFPLLGAAFVSNDADVARITRQPLVAIWDGYGSNTEPLQPGQTMAAAEFYALSHGAERQVQSEMAILNANREILRHRKRNVIFVILESVGSLQLLKNGQPDSELAPFLAEQAGNSIIFENLANTFPASTRSHIALAAGGRTMTWGSVYSELQKPYLGQTIVSAFQEDARKTALFSAAGLDYENLKAFYASLGYDKLFDPQSMSAEWVDAHRTHSWGVDERAVLGEALDWMKSAPKPFFANFLTVMTHHPYGAPADFISPFKGDDSLSRYKTSIYFTDSVLRQLADGLVSLGLAKDTLIVVSGDHGEAFGLRHKDNFAHKNYLYEENIRNFMMMIDLSHEITPVSSARRAMIGDMMPTILDSQGLAVDPGIPGQSLLSPMWKERIAYFHKNSHPELWGLRDGNWKFIVEKNGSANAELFDLDADPGESINLASQHPDWVADYVNRLSNWFVYTNEQFVSHLEGYDRETRVTMAAADMLAPGPKHIDIGMKRNYLPFVPLQGSVNPAEALTIRTNGPAYPVDTSISYVFTSPSGKRESVSLLYDHDWSTVYLYEHSTKPREEGSWKLELFDGEKLVIATSFEVSNKAPLHWSFADSSPGLRELSFGFKPTGEDFRKLERINPMEKMAALTHGIPFGEERKLDYYWLPPTGTGTRVSMFFAPDWDSAWVYNSQNGPMEEGEWRLEIWDGSKFLIGGNFTVSANAPVYAPVNPAN